MRSRTLGLAIAVVALVGIGALTLWPRPELAPLSAATPVWCVVCGSHGLVDVVLNVFLFVPLGIGLGVAGLRMRTALLIAAATTLTVELLQLSVVAGRDSSLSDLVTNTLGAALGYLAARHSRSLVLPAPAAARRLAALWAALVLAVAAITGLSVAPSMPGPPYWGQWTPELGGLLQHEGRVESAAVEGIEMPSRRLPRSQELADSLADGEISATVTATLAGRPARTAPIFRVVDGYGRQALLVAQAGSDLIVESGTRSERLRLRGLTVRMPGVLPNRARVRIAVASDRREYGVVVHNLHGSAQSLTAARSVAWGWALLLPFLSRIDERRQLLDGLWLAALMLPLGWWVRWGVGGVAGLVVAAAGSGAFLALVLAGIPLLLGLAAAGAGAWTGGAIGWGAGLAAALVTRVTTRGSVETYPRI